MAGGRDDADCARVDVAVGVVVVTEHIHDHGGARERGHGVRDGHRRSVGHLRVRIVAGRDGAAVRRVGVAAAQGLTRVADVGLIDDLGALRHGVDRTVELDRRALAVGQLAAHRGIGTLAQPERDYAPGEVNLVVAQGIGLGIERIGVPPGEDVGASWNVRQGIGDRVVEHHERRRVVAGAGGGQRVADDVPGVDRVCVGQVLRGLDHVDDRREDVRLEGHHCRVVRVVLSPGVGGVGDGGRSGRVGQDAAGIDDVGVEGHLVDVVRVLCREAHVIDGHRAVEEVARRVDRVAQGRPVQLHGVVDEPHVPLVDHGPDLRLDGAGSRREEARDGRVDRDRGGAVHDGVAIKDHQVAERHGQVLVDDDESPGRIPVHGAAGRLDVARPVGAVGVREAGHKGCDVGDRGVVGAVRVEPHRGHVDVATAGYTELGDAALRGVAVTGPRQFGEQDRRAGRQIQVGRRGVDGR